MKVSTNLQRYIIAAFLAGVFVLTGCDNEEPEPVNEPEVITDVKLIFTNDANANDVVEARAQDPDGEGVEELRILDDITLKVNTTYTLTYEILNSLVSPAEDIGEEILDEDDEHQIFFQFTEGAFTNPTGNGNIDRASDPINYNDSDDNNRPVGLSTTWTTSATAIDGTFTAKLQHQPDVKTDTSGATDGDTDFDLTFTLKVQ